MAEGTALEKRQAGNPGARVQIPPSPFSSTVAYTVVFICPFSYKQGGCDPWRVTASLCLSCSLMAVFIHLFKCYVETPNYFLEQQSNNISTSA